MEKKTPSFQWIDAAKARGWDGSLRLAFEVLEPFAPIASQMLWVAQPMAGVFGGEAAIKELAEALDSAEGIAALKNKLAEK